MKVISAIALVGLMILFFPIGIWVLIHTIRLRWAFKAEDKRRLKLGLI